MGVAAVQQNALSGDAGLILDQAAQVIGVRDLEAEQVQRDQRQLAAVRLQHQRPGVQVVVLPDRR